MESTPGDSDGDRSGSILATSQGVQTMPQENLLPDQQGTPEPTATTPTTPATPPAPATPDINASASPVTPTPPAPAVISPEPAKPPRSNKDTILMMYERGDLPVDIMAQACDQNWTPAQALQARDSHNAVHVGVNDQQNKAGFPQGTPGKGKEPNGDMIMAAAFLMEHCGFQPSDFDSSVNKKATLKLDERTIDAATSGDFRGIRFSDLCAHAAESFYNGKMPNRKRIGSRSNMDLFQTCVRFQPEIDARLDFEFADDIRADADTGLSTIGLRNIWALINTHTIGKAYDTVPTIWQEICKKASVPNFLKHTVHRVEMVGDFQRLSRIGEEPPHLTYMESQSESQIDTWGAMLTLSRKDIINDEVGIFVDAAQKIGRKAAEKLEQECFAALLSDKDKLFSTAHKNRLPGGASSVFSFESLDAAFDLFYNQKSQGGTPIMVQPSFLLIPSTMRFKVERLLTMGTTDGLPKGALTLHQNYPFKVSPFLRADNGLQTVEGSQIKKIAGSNDGWYLFANPNDMPVIVATLRLLLVAYDNLPMVFTENKQFDVVP
ncbi:MAG: hypothetical protein LBI05_08065 [Planctomycetaceae bacterium]|nr:hypothetical protein [Planctomycetaceae bacterium]